jgi:SAM-dependent methyltransferase
MDASFWNSRYGKPEYVYGTEPNDFLTAHSGQLPEGAEVLCLADGEGRNGVHLASLGLRVTAVDSSSVGLEKARRLAAERQVPLDTLVADLAAWDLGVDRWDAVVSIWAHLPPEIRATLHPRIARAIRPGGVLLMEHYHPKQISYGTGGPPDPTMMLTLAELERDFAPWEHPHVFEGERDVQEGAGHGGLSYVTQAILRKPVGPASRPEPAPPLEADEPPTEE